MAWLGVVLREVRGRALGQRGIRRLSQGGGGDLLVLLVWCVDERETAT